MTINKDLNVSPYFDDYDEDKNFHRVLFKPSTAVQAREMTQLQTILQHQVERFGENILVEGSIVKGGNFVDLKNLPYIKILDNNTNNQPVVMENYLGTLITGKNTGVTAQVVTTLTGLETQSPNLNTLYVKYLNTGQDVSGNDIKQFLPGETLEFSVDGVVQDTLTVAVAGLAVDSAPIGNGYAVRCGEGIIFQKGHFIRFEDQIRVVSRYSTSPTDTVVGFQTEETIVTSNNDTSLLDNASGFNNENAPGADRLKLTPILVSTSVAQAESDESFFAIQEYQNGRLVRRNVTTQFNSINKLVEQRTAEESGNYTVNDFNVRIGDNTANTAKLSAFVSPGVAYVEGHRVELVGTLDVDIERATETDSVDQQDILANYGNYLIVDKLFGSFPTDTSGSVDLYNAAQTATSTIGFTAAGGKIGTARIRAVTTHDATKYRLYIFNIVMNSGQVFNNVRSVTFGANAFANNVVENGKAALKDGSFKKLVFPIGRDAIKTVKVEGSDYVARKQETSSANTSGGFAITTSGTDTFPYGGNATLNSDQLDELIISFTSNGAISRATSASTNADGTTLTVDMAGTYSAGTPIDVSYNVKINDVKPSGKLLTTVYMRINPSANTSGTYHLGWPDVQSIEGIWKGVNSTFDENTAGITDVKDNFVLYKNQTDEFYDISYIKKRRGTISTSDRFLVKAKVFIKSDTGSFGQSFFSVNSYPVDDSTVTLPSNKMRTEDIGAYKLSSGDTVYLRDVIDFRPYADNNAAYATSPATASIWTNTARLNAVDFGTAPLNLISPNRSLEVGYEYYLGRRDKLVINEKGDFVNIEGVSSDSPAAPNTPAKTMAIATVNIPPFPSLTSIKANRAGKSSYGVSFTREDNRRYTMGDIGKIEKRIEKIEYYTVLNALEKSAEDLIVSGADGLNRFKNGILVDSFENLAIANVRDDDFAASVDPSEKQLSPSFRSYNIGLKVHSKTNVIDNDESVITLPYVQRSMISQPYSTTFRNCVTDFYNFAGIAKLWPEYDGAPDFTRAPDINFDIDLATPFVEFTDKLSEFVPLSSSDTRELVRRSTSTVGRTTTTTTTTRSNTFNAELEVTKGKNTTQKVGDFVTDFQFNPFLRQNIVRVFVSGMRPNTLVHFFFDGKNVDEHIARGVVAGNSIKTIRRTERFKNSNKRTDAKGNLAVLFNIPADTFYVGDRELLILDVNDLNAVTAATTSASVMYRGFNFSVEKSGLEISTREPNFDINRSVDKNISITTNSVTLPTPTNPTPAPLPQPAPQVTRRRKDPIAQTFQVEEDYSSDSAVMITSIDVYFQKKSSTAGVTLELRNTENGFPGPKILPFGRVRLNPNEVNVSANGSVKTTFVFPSPVTLATATDYCFVILPDGANPDYRIWVAKNGQNDTVRGTKITQDTNSGTLFTSTNNKAWTPYQDEDIKFNIYKASFTAKSGSVHLTNDHDEFLSLSEFSGNFRRGETAFVVNPNNAGTISVSPNTNTITGTGTAFTSLFTTGDYIAYRVTDTDYEVSRVASITNNTTMVLDETPKDANTSTNYFITTAGTVDYFNNRAPVRLHLKGSSAKTGRVFAENKTIRGELSEAVATIGEVIDLPVSHMQANIYRTNFTRTKTNLLATRLNNGSSNYATNPINMVFNDNNYLNTQNTVIKSRSNEVTENAGTDSFMLRVDMFNTSKTTLDTSPTIDHEISSITAFEYFINPASTSVLDSEKAAFGDASAKYISKTVQLADGFDAEDLRVWLTAYRPTGSDISVFARFKAESDQTAINNVAWTRLDVEGRTNLFSSVANRDNFKEFEYYLGSTVKGAGEGAYINSSGEFTYTSEDGVIFKDFKFFDIKIVLNGSGQHRIPRIKDMRAIALT